MPYYEYECSDCRARFELKRRLAEIDEPVTCPECQGDRVARQVSLVMAFSHGEGGSVSALAGGGGCASCGGGACGSCGHSHN
ncbi:MAG: zinc ribbon domain-containing protein [Chloroflexi bacterium]|nr:zinc ribbon domain-containing protein [Chloroflexota bacterium]